MIRKLFAGLSTRIYTIVLLATVTMAGLSALLFDLATENAYKMREHHLSDVVDSAVSVLETLQSQVDIGEISPDTAQMNAQRVLQNMRFGDAGYFYVIDRDYVVQVHPNHPEWVGTNQRGYTDENGFAVFESARDIGANSERGAFTYDFENPATGAVEKKITFVREFQPWGWSVAAGAYLSDIRAELAPLRWFSIGVTLVALIALAGLSSLIVRSITRPLAALIGRMAEMTHGDIEATIPHVEADGEMGAMARSIEVFRAGLRERRDLEAEQAAQEAQMHRERAEAQERAHEMQVREAEAERKHEEERLKAERDMQRAQAEADRARTNSEQTQIVESLAKGLEAMSRGDLSLRLSTPFPEAYEKLRNDYNHAAARVSELVGTIVEGAGSIGRETDTLSSSARELSQRTETQAASLEQTAASITQLSASVENSATGARNAAETVTEARNCSDKGADVVQRTISAMGEIADSSGRIARITGVIDDIAFQTNLLALNAGVEAARAGEAGRGFAVVASEVRALAQRSSEAAREIADLIHTSSQQVENGVELVNESGVALEDISALVSRLDDLVSAMAETSSQQSVGLSEVSTAVTSLDLVTQQNAAMFQETTAAVHALQQQAKTLEQNGAGFRLETSHDRFRTAS